MIHFYQLKKRELYTRFNLPKKEGGPRGKKETGGLSERA